MWSCVGDKFIPEALAQAGKHDLGEPRARASNKGVPARLRQTFAQSRAKKRPALWRLANQRRTILWLASGWLDMNLDVLRSELRALLVRQEGWTLWRHRCGCYGHCKRTGEERWLPAYIPDHPTIREEDVGCINAPHSVGAVHVLALWCLCVCWLSLPSLAVTCPGHDPPEPWRPPSVSSGQKVGKAAL